MKQLFNPITATVWKGGHGASSSICPTKQAVHCVPIIPYRLQCILGIFISLIFFFTTAPLFAGDIPAPTGVRIIKIVDNGDDSTSSTGNWQVSGSADPHGDSSLYSKEGGAIYTFEAAIGGVHEVSLWWTEWASRSTNVPVKIYDGGTLLDTIEVNQRTNGGKWNELGAYEFNSGTAKVTILAQNNYSTCADAVKFDPNPSPSPPPPPPSTEFHPGFFASAGFDNITNTLNLIGDNPDFIGIRKYYIWSDVETSKGVYDFSEIVSDLAAVQAKGKRLWIFIAHSTYSSGGGPRTPTYMCSDSKYGGESPYYGVYERTVAGGGWIPIIWNSEVQARFDALFTALGNRFNGEAYVEGMNLDETSIGRPPGDQFGYSPAGVLAGFQVIALAAKTAFPDKSVIQQINFAMFDREAFGAWCASNDIGIGCPDFRISDPINDSLYTIVYPIMKEYRDVVHGGPDVQWGDYEEINPETGRYCTAAELLDASIDLVDPWYFFWVNREPYFTDDVIPAIRKFHDEGHSLGHD